MIAILYARVSTDEQAREGFSLASQLETCRKRALAIGATDPIECVDEGVSGEILNRPGLTRARELIRRGGIGAFVCLDPDRFARKLSHQLLVTEEIERAGVKLEFLNFEWRDTPEGKLFYSLRGAIAEFEKEKIRERTMHGKLQKARQGGLPHWPGTYGYSYTRRDGSRDGFATIHESEAAVVRQIFDWFVHRDLGYLAIARRLNAEGTPSPRGGGWSRTTIRRILTNRAYTGDMAVFQQDTAGVKNNRYRPPDERMRRRRRLPDEWIHISLPAIVDRKTWEAARAKAASVRRIYAGRPRTDYLLSGLIHCRLCGSTVHGALATSGSGRKIAYYVCSNRSPGKPGQPRCKLPFLPRDFIDEQVWTKIVLYLLDDMTMAQCHARESLDTGVEAERLARRLKEATCERERLLDALQKGLASPEEIGPRLNSIRTCIGDLTDRLEEMRGSASPSPDNEIAFALKEGLANVDFASRREVVRLLVRRVSIGPEEITITGLMPGP